MANSKTKKNYRRKPGTTEIEYEIEIIESRPVSYYENELRHIQTQIDFLTTQQVLLESQMAEIISLKPANEQLVNYAIKLYDQGEIRANIKKIIMGDPHNLSNPDARDVCDLAELIISER